MSVVLCCVVLCCVVLAGVRVAHGVHEDTAAVTGERLVPLRHYYTTPLCITTPLRCYSTALLLHCVATPLRCYSTTPLCYYSTASFHYYHIPLLHNCMTTLHYSTLLYMSCLIISSGVSYPLLYSVTCIAQGDCRWPTPSLHWCTQRHSVHRTHHWSAQSLQWTRHHSDLLRA
jgi:hypothetical protein